MALFTLFKAPGETIAYTLDFTTLVGYVGPRGTVWPQGVILHTGENFTGSPTVDIQRDDGQQSDLTVTGQSASGGTISFTLAGGTDGVTYQITASAATSTGQTRTGQALLGVATTLPDQ